MFSQDLNRILQEFNFLEECCSNDNKTFFQEFSLRRFSINFLLTYLLYWKKVQFSKKNIKILSMENCFN